MKKILFSVLICFALLLTNMQASATQAKAPTPEDYPTDRFPEIIREKTHLEPPEPPVIFPDDLPEGWRHSHFEEIEEREYIPPTEESLRLTQEQVQSFDCGTVTDVPRVECEALVALYESTDGAGWYDKTNWLQTTTVGNWYGVVVSEGYIIGIDLFQNGLWGELPNMLSNLVNIWYLDLSVNNLNGTSLAMLGNLGNLQYLYLFSSQLTGSIPVELSNLANLKCLWLGGNQLTGSIPTEIGNLVN